MQTSGNNLLTSVKPLKSGHSQIQNRPLGVKTGRHRGSHHSNRLSNFIASARVSGRPIKLLGTRRSVF
jgi:hypothetical protein